MAGEPVRLAFIGCGGMSRSHLHGWRALHSKGAAFEVVGCADALESLAAGHARTAAEFQGRAPAVYTDWRRMVEEIRPDAVDICTPHDLHHVVACGCLEAGVDAIVEKPLAITLRAGRRMLETAARTGRILAVAEQVRRWPGPRALAWAAQGGPLGRPLAATIVHAGGSRRDPGASARGGPMPWRLDRLQSGGGVIIDVGVHMADMLLACFGPIRRVTAQAGCLDPRPFEDGRSPSVEDIAGILLEFESGMTATWTQAGVLAGEPLHRNAYFGSGGSVLAEGYYPEAPRFTAADRSSELDAPALVGAYLQALAPAERERVFPAWVCPDPVEFIGRDIGVQLELADFLDAVRSRRGPEVAGAEGFAAQAVAAAVLESAEAGGQPLVVAEVAAGEVSLYQDGIDTALGLL